MGGHLPDEQMKRKIFHWSHLRASIWAFVLENSLSFHIIWPLFHEHTDPTYFMFILLLSSHLHSPISEKWSMLHPTQHDKCFAKNCYFLVNLHLYRQTQNPHQQKVSNILQLFASIWTQPIMIALETLQVYSSANLWGNAYSSKGQIVSWIRTNLLSLMKLRWGVMEKSNIISMRN